jgi:hypothetical protein
MWHSVFSTGLITVIILLILHHTYNHLTYMLTAPKIADFVRRPTAKYAEIEKLVAETPERRPPAETKAELRTFLKHLKH